jgi:hypothetical protein
VLLITKASHAKAFSKTTLMPLIICPRDFQAFELGYKHVDNEINRERFAERINKRR